MSKRISLLSIILIFGLTGLVQAQDAFNWSGFYIGGNIGGNWIHYDAGTSADTVTSASTVDGNIPFTRLFPLPPFETSETALIGGGQLGYNLQFGIFVLGLEGGFDGIWSSNGKTTLPRNSPLDLDLAERDFDRNWSASACLRAGVAWNKFLFYATGGGAFSEVTLHVRDGEGGPAPGAVPIASSSDNTVAGWTAGVGADYAISKAVSIGLEYRHTGFGSESYTPTAGSAPILGSVGPGSTHISFHATSVSVSDNQITFQVNLLFSGLMEH